MKWSEFKNKVDTVITKESKDDPDIGWIDVSAGMLMVDPEINIQINNNELEVD